MKFNLLKSKKGQAFSTFQLLIAAVVALAILALLLPMITKNINIGTSPVDSMKNLLKTAPDQPGTLLKSDEIKFSAKETEYINTKAIISGTGLSSEQVRFSNNGYDNDFEIQGDGAILNVKKDESVKYQIAVLCDYSFLELSEDMDDFDLSDLDISEDYFGDPNATCCIVYPIKR